MGETAVTDGRTGRAARTRAAVVDALLALIEAGNLRPTARQVADEAGVSLRSVYVHFDDVESLFVAAATRHYQRMEALWQPCDGAGTREERVDRFAAQRRLLAEESGAVRRAAALQEPFSPVLQQAFDRGRRAVRADVEATFAPELGAQPDHERSRLRAALEIVASGDSWDELRRHQGMAADEAADLLRDMIHATLRAWDGPHGATGDPPPRRDARSTG